MILSKVALIDLGLQAHRAGERLGEVGVHALDGLAVRADELVGRVARVGGDGQRALGLDRRRDERRDRRSAPEAVELVDEDVDEDELDVVLLLLLLPHPATADAASASTANAIVGRGMESFHLLLRGSSGAPPDPEDTAADQTVERQRVARRIAHQRPGGMLLDRGARMLEASDYAIALGAVGQPRRLRGAAPRCPGGAVGAPALSQVFAPKWWW